MHRPIHPINGPTASRSFKCTESNNRFGTILYYRNLTKLIRHVIVTAPTNETVLEGIWCQETKNNEVSMCHHQEISHRFMNVCSTEDCNTASPSLAFWQAYHFLQGFRFHHCTIYWICTTWPICNHSSQVA